MPVVTPSALSEAIVDILLEAGPYRFVTNCMGCDSGEKIRKMVDSATEVTYDEFMRHVDLNDLLTMTPASMYAWSPQALKRAQFSSEDAEAYRSQRSNLRMRDDWAISFHKGKFEGRPCYYLDHSRIDYIFCR